MEIAQEASGQENGGAWSARTVGYWAATCAFGAVMVGGGVGSLLGAEPMRTDIVGLGYPAFVMTILGIAKLSGVVALLLPGTPKLKEWAYAGFTFDLLGAAASHALVGHPFLVTVKPLAVLLLALASYALRPNSRRLDPVEARGQASGSPR